MPEAAEHKASMCQAFGSIPSTVWPAPQPPSAPLGLSPRAQDHTAGPSISGSTPPSSTTECGPYLGAGGSEEKPMAPFNVILIAFFRKVLIV